MDMRILRSRLTRRARYAPPLGAAGKMILVAAVATIGMQRKRGWCARIPRALLRAETGLTLANTQSCAHMRLPPLLVRQPTWMLPPHLCPYTAPCPFMLFGILHAAVDTVQQAL